MGSDLQGGFPREAWQGVHRLFQPLYQHRGRQFGRGLGQEAWLQGQPLARLLQAPGHLRGLFKLGAHAQLALELADQAYVIETGRIVMSGNAKDIANNEDVRKSYLGY